LTLLLGLVFLMTTKPNLVGSFIVMGVRAADRLAAGVLVSRMRRAPEPEMVDQKVQEQRADWLNSVERAGMNFSFPGERAEKIFTRRKVVSLYETVVSCQVLSGCDRLKENRRTYDL